MAYIVMDNEVYLHRRLTDEAEKRECSHIAEQALRQLQSEECTCTHVRMAHMLRAWHICLRAHIATADRSPQATGS